jgi:hypothetical protein
VVVAAEPAERGRHSQPGAYRGAMAGDRRTDEANVWFVTVRPDGRPHVAPVWFAYVDDAFWVATGATSVKVRNLRTNAAVSVHLESGAAPVVADGHGQVVPRPFPAAVAAAFHTKYAWDITVDVDDDLGEVTLVRVDVRRWVMGGP